MTYTKERLKVLAGLIQESSNQQEYESELAAWEEEERNLKPLSANSSAGFELVRLKSDIKSSLERMVKRNVNPGALEHIQKALELLTRAENILRHDTSMEQGPPDIDQ